VGAVKARRLIGLYLLGVAVMYFALVLVSFIPNDWIRANVEAGQAVYESEFIGQWTPFFAYGQSDKLDLGTDNLIMETLLTRNDQNVFQKAVEGYAETRYWQGYKVWLRPAFCLFTYTDLRTVMMFTLAGLAVLCLVRTQKRFGAGTAAGLGVALALGHFFVVPWLFQYFEVFWIALAALAYVLRREKAGPGFFLVVGMATQYFDFLTAPVLTLCLPLSAVVLADLREDRLTLRERWAHLIDPCIAWSAGWLGGWASKWPISTLLLGRDVLGDALHQAVYRSAAGEDAGVLRSLARNIFCFLPMNQLHVRGADALLAAITFAEAAWLLAMAVRLAKRRPDWKKAGPALFCAAIPYLWFIVLAGHTDEHYIFTYRSQIATAFVLCGAWLALYEKGREPT